MSRHTLCKLSHACFHSESLKPTVIFNSPPSRSSIQSCISLSLPQSTSSSLESVNSQSLWQRLPRSLPLPFLCLSSCLLGLLASASPVSFRVLSLYPPFLRSLQHSSVYMLCSPPPSSSHLSIFHYSSATILHCALAKKRFCKNPMGKKEKGHCRLAVREEE